MLNVQSAFICMMRSIKHGRLDRLVFVIAHYVNKGALALLFGLASEFVEDLESDFCPEPCFLYIGQLICRSRTFSGPQHFFVFIVQSAVGSVRHRASGSGLLHPCGQEE